MKYTRKRYSLVLHSPMPSETRQHWDGDHVKGPCLSNGQKDEKNFALTLTDNLETFQLA